MPLRSAKRQKILGVDYTHLNLGDRGDLYLTDDGVPWVECLLPENFWTDKEWFEKNSEKLSGTSSIHRVRTKEVNGKQRDIVFKWNRMGQDIPGDMEDPMLATAEFNSPFEEFSLANECQESIRMSGMSIIIHKPLAIYVRADRSELWRMGRREYMMKAIIEKHVEIELDMFRSYAVIYEWMKGIDVIQAFCEGLVDEAFMESLTMETYEEMVSQGFNVKDHKPHHIIIRPRPNGQLSRDREENIVCGIVDYELLCRTPERQQIVKEQRRQEYLKKQRDRFAVKIPESMPSGLAHVNIMDVDYIFGHCESTNGLLWVVGKDPDLFEYFLPEKWEKASRNRLSAYSEIYHTLTKDNVNLVWKVSKVGIQPDVDPFREDEKKILQFGYKSPFEEVSLAIILSRAGIPTIYPRAVYMTGVKTETPDTLLDTSRYESHKQYLNPCGSCILRPDRDYILIWGFWNGPDEKLADEDGNYYRGVDALRALREGIISQERYMSLLKTMKERLLKVGVEDLNLRGSHILLSTLARTGHIITDKDNMPEMRLCSFELLKRL